MAFEIRRVDYFYTTVKDQPGEAYKLLSLLASMGIKLLAFTAVPFGPMTTQLTIFPEDTGKLVSEARKSDVVLDGPHPALLNFSQRSLRFHFEWTVPFLKRLE